MMPCIINPSRGRKERVLPPVGLLLLTPTDAALLPSLAGEHGLERRFLYHSQLYAGQDFFLAGPAIGSPMAVLCLEKLVALGARSILVYGWCGGLVEQCSAGDLIVPTWARSEEGTSEHYGPNPEYRPDAALRAWLLTQVESTDLAIHQGPLWTTDAPYRETVAKVADYGREGILGVEMEYSALCAVARFRGVRLAAVMLVSDELWSLPWKPAFTGKAFRQRSQSLSCLLSQRISAGIDLV